MIWRYEVRRDVWVCVGGSCGRMLSQIWRVVQYSMLPCVHAINGTRRRHCAYWTHCMEQMS